MAKIQIEINGQLHDVKKTQLFDYAKSGIVDRNTRLVYEGQELKVGNIRGIEFVDGIDALALNLLSESKAATNPIPVPLSAFQKKKSIPTKRIKQWFDDFGYDGPLPKSPAELRDFYEKFINEQKPSDDQLKDLSALGYKGAPPQSVSDAAKLINEFEFTEINREEFEGQLQELSERGYKGKMPKTLDEADSIIHRLDYEEWVKEYRDNFRYDMEEDLEKHKDDFEFEPDTAVKIVGWRLEMGETCPYKGEKEGKIYPAQLQVSDIVKHLPPYEGCSKCEFRFFACRLKKVVLNDLPIIDDQHRCTITLWDNPKFRKKIPKHIKKVF